MSEPIDTQSEIAADGVATATFEPTDPPAETMLY